jgi:hypothetical protein
VIDSNRILSKQERHAKPRRQAGVTIRRSKRARTLGPLLLACAFVGASAARAQATRRITIDGLVADTSLAPLAGAQITLMGTGVQVTTGESGRFRIRDVPLGHYLIVVRRLGYRPTSGIMDLSGADTLRVSYTLEPSPPTLPGVVIEERSIPFRLLDFEMRRRAGLGTFFTEDDLERRHPVLLSDILNGVLGVQVAPRRGGGHVVRARRGGSSASACSMKVYLDDMPRASGDDLDGIPPRELAGIEIYLGPAEIPPRYNGPGSGCGVMMLWTKIGT